MVTVLASQPLVLTSTLRRQLNQLVDYGQLCFVAAREGVTSSDLKVKLLQVSQALGLNSVEELRTWWQLNRKFNRRIS